MSEMQTLPEIMACLQEPMPFQVKPKTVRFFDRDNDPGIFKAQAIAYIDRYDVQKRLDEVLGMDGWQTSYTVIDFEARIVECRLAIRNPAGKWIWKSDVGGPNAERDPDKAEGGRTDAWKGAYSDALKRAATHFGIGRFLSEIPIMWLECEAKPGQGDRKPRFVKWSAADVNEEILRRARLPQRQAATPPPPPQTQKAPAAVDPSTAMDRLKSAREAARLHQADIIRYCRETFGERDPRDLGANQIEALIHDVAAGKVRAAA